jgi:hypothetical protein
MGYVWVRVSCVLPVACSMKAQRKGKNVYMHVHTLCQCVCTQSLDEMTAIAYLRCCV